MKNIKSASLAAATALALTALLGVASASASQFRAEAYPATVTGSQGKVHEITVSTGVIKCATATVAGTLPGASSTATLTPAFTSCKAFGVKATSAVNSCSYVLQSTNESAPFSGTVGISCSKSGDAIEFSPTGMACQVTIPAQSGVGSVEFENTGLNKKRAIALSLNVSSLQYTETGAACGSPGAHSNGAWTGTSTLEGQTEPEGPRQGLYLAKEQIAASPTLLRVEHFPAFVKGAQASALLSTYTFPIKGQLSLEGSMSTASGEVTLLPSFSGFTWAGVGVTVKTNGCYFVLHVTSEVSGTASIGCEKPGPQLP